MQPCGVFSGEMLVSESAQDNALVALLGVKGLAKGFENGLQNGLGEGVEGLSNVSR